MHSNKTSYSGITPKWLGMLWRYWALTFGSLVLPVVVGMFIPRMITPILILVLAGMMRVVSQSASDAPSHGFSITARTAQISLLISGLILLAISILRSERLYGWWFDSLNINPNMPFISGIIIFPVTALVSAFELLTFRHNYFARQHRHPSGVFVGDSTLGTYIYRESRYRLTLLMVLTGLLGIVNTWYWSEYYIDINFNSPDYFFFLVLPLGVYIGSLIFIRLRYAQVIVLLHTFEADRTLDKGTTILRYLLLSGDRLLLRPTDQGKWDTPFEVELRHSPNRTRHQEAESLLYKKLGRSDVEVKYIYTNSGGTGLRFEHYAAFLPASEAEISAESGREATVGKSGDEAVPVADGRWFSLDAIDRCMRTGELSPMLTSEVYRIFTITMAWKTYDRQGRRLYPIKNYRPTFRLRDMRQWDVDYDDTYWFRVAADNEDQRFYRLRRTWRGLFSRKKTERQP